MLELAAILAAALVCCRAHGSWATVRSGTRFAVLDGISSRQMERTTHHVSARR
jgi:hypothetical protein